MNFVFPNVNPIVRNTVSFPGTVLSYTSHSFALGVPAEPITPIRYVTVADAVLQIAILDTTAVSAAPVENNVVYVLVPAVPCT